MKPLALLCSFALALPALAGESPKPWPQKGDTVYVAARLSGSNAVTLIVPGIGGGKMPDVPTLEPCSPVTVRKVGSSGTTVIVQDDDRHERRLDGPWAPALAKTAGECRQIVESLGLPRVKSRGGYRYEIVPAESAAPRGEHQIAPSASAVRSSFLTARPSSFGLPPIMVP